MGFGDCMWWACTFARNWLGSYVAVEMHPESASMISETLSANRLLINDLCNAAQLTVSAVAASDREESDAVAFAHGYAAALSSLESPPVGGFVVGENNGSLKSSVPLR